MRTFPFGGGSVEIGDDGSVVSVMHPRRGHSVLLLEDTGSIDAYFHEPARRWGKGFLVSDAGSHRFDAPSRLTWHDDGADIVYELGSLRLAVVRRIGADWHETYALRNDSGRAVTVGSLAVSTPWRDVYSSAKDSLERAVHAHVWTGGCDSWVWAVPMDGSGPGLGLPLTEGELWSYSVESRDAHTGSNVRGHLYLHVTDHSRSPDAMGGQPQIVVPPGDGYAWSWRLRWYDDLPAFAADRPRLMDVTTVAAETGRTIAVDVAAGVRLSERVPVVSHRPGFRHVFAESGGRRSRIGLLFHPPLREMVERRARFVLDHQRPVERSDSRRAAFVPFDNRSDLRVLPAAWADWDDSAERVGTALMLQEMRRLGWGDAAEITEALAAYDVFVTEHIVSGDGTVGGAGRRESPRLYNFPWFARFVLDQGHLDRAVQIMDRYYALGGDHFLAFELGPLLRELAGRLDELDRTADAARMREHLMGHARAFIEHGADLPRHEVNYEQSMVAPLVDLLLSAHLVDPDVVPSAELHRRLAWLTAFAADQPDARLMHMPIRHWDGYWFGGLRLWGDVFPHYWSVLSAGVFLSWPEGLGERDLHKSLRRAGYAILRGNLAAFAPDGSATCAFVYPSCVNGSPAHVADPLANDQDWALVYAMRFGLGPDPSS